MGYNSESKGYIIYWPEKRLITIECNIIFNQDDINTCDNTAIIYGKVQSEGEKIKVIQTSQHNARDVEAPENKNPSDQQTLVKQSEPHPSPKSSNSIPFPSTNESQPQPELDPNPQEENQQYSHGQRPRPEKGHYKTINEGLVAAITAIVEEPNDNAQENVKVEPCADINEDLDNSYELPLSLALLGYSSTVRGCP